MPLAPLQRLGRARSGRPCRWRPMRWRRPNALSKRQALPFDDAAAAGMRMLHEIAADLVVLVAEAGRHRSTATPAGSADFRFRRRRARTLRARTISSGPRSDRAITRFDAACRTATASIAVTVAWMTIRQRGCSRRSRAAVEGEAVEAAVERPERGRQRRGRTAAAARPPRAASSAVGRRGGKIEHRPRLVIITLKLVAADRPARMRHANRASRDRSDRARRSGRPRSRWCRRRIAAAISSS